MNRTVIGIICSAVLLSSALGGCNLKMPLNSADGSKTAATEGSALTNSIDSPSSSAVSDSPVFNGSAVANSIKVEGDNYSSGSEYLILTLTNGSGFDCDLDISVDLFDSDDKLIKSGADSIEAFAKGTTVALAFESDQNSQGTNTPLRSKEQTFTNALTKI